MSVINVEGLSGSDLRLVADLVDRLRRESDKAEAPPALPNPLQSLRDVLSLRFQGDPDMAARIDEHQP